MLFLRSSDFVYCDFCQFQALNFYLAHRISSSIIGSISAVPGGSGFSPLRGGRGLISRTAAGNQAYLSISVVKKKIK